MSEDLCRTEGVMLGKPQSSSSDPMTGDKIELLVRRIERLESASRLERPPLLIRELQRAEAPAKSKDGVEGESNLLSNMQDSNASDVEEEYYYERRVITKHQGERPSSPPPATTVKRWRKVRSRSRSRSISSSTSTYSLQTQESSSSDEDWKSGEINLERIQISPSYQEKRRKKAKEAGRSFVLTWKTSPRHLSAYQIVIRDESLKSIIKECLEDYPGHYGERVLRFDSPFFPIVHCWDRLEDYMTNTETTENATLADVRGLMALMRKHSSLREHLTVDKPRYEGHSVAFNDLWTIFPPGEMIYGIQHEHPQVFSVADMDYQRSRNGFHTARIWCWSYGFDGTKFGRTRSAFQIPRYSGKRAIDSLEIHPLKLRKDARDILKKLKIRGQRYRELCLKPQGQKMLHYNGQAVTNDDQELKGMVEPFSSVVLMAAFSERNFDLSLPTRKRHYDGPVMIDVESFEKYGDKEILLQLMSNSIAAANNLEFYFECDCGPCRTNKGLQARLKRKYDNVQQDEHGNWPKFEENQYAMCEPFVRGYLLNSKCWALLAVDDVEDSPPSDRNAAFNYLCLADDDRGMSSKHLIRTLVEDHGKRHDVDRPYLPDPLQDFVKGKGKGLVVLLHGTTGVGKTLTAECVAQYTGKPLLKVGLADLGIDVTKIEEKLNTIFVLASTWEAILLFDEADIFLEARAIEDDLTRNSIVSLFLKVLDYYEGILFLTTNRIKSFDIALQSRVTLALHFGEMGEKQQKRVLRVFLERIDERQVKNKEKILDWVDDDFREKFNGRDIRNMLSSAMTHARAEERQLELRDIKIMRDSKRRFKEHLQEQTILAQKRNE